MTTNTYNNAENQKRALAKKDAHAVSGERRRVRNPQSTAGKGQTQSNQKRTLSEAERLEMQRRAAARKRAKAHTAPEAVRPKLPAILGFDTRDKFITETASAVNKYPLILKIAATLLITFMFMCVLINAVDVNRIKMDTTEKSNLLEELIERDAELSLALEKRDNAEAIRGLAQKKYGMIEKKNVTKHHISMDNEDRIVIIGENSENGDNNS